MCNLAGTGIDDAPLILLTLLLLATGSLILLILRGRGRLALLLVVTLALGASALGAPQSASAACGDPTAPPAPQAVLSASVATISIDLGAPSGDVTITNVSSVTALDLDVSSVDLPAGMVISASTCIGSLAPGASCVVALSGDGSSPPFTSTLRIAGSNTPELLIAVVGAQYALLSAAPNPLVFIGDGSQSVVITNQSASVSAIIDTLTTPTQPALITDPSNCSGVILPGASCTVYVIFDSSLLGSGTFSIDVLGNFPTLTIPVFTAI
jgi:adhesin HecA-like repeat protein